MVQAIERKTYQIPIPDGPLTIITGWTFVQTREIPVGYRESFIPPLRLVYLDFSFNQSESSTCILSPLSITAGGEKLETAQDRIRSQMLHRLQTGLATTQKQDQSQRVRLEIEELSLYFQLIQRPIE